MDVRSVQFFAAACGGELRGAAPTAEATRVCTDSRQLRAGDLFVALSGEKFDGHKFLSEAVQKGAVGVVVEKGKPLPDLGGCATIVVSNTRAALGKMAAVYRSGFQVPVTAVCGSNGKTTTKELVASVLRQKMTTLSSEGSFNNDIGVPLTVLYLESTHKAAVLEAGTNHPGELRPLLEIIAPRYGVLTNIGREHLEFFGSTEGVAQEEGNLAEILPPDGTLFLNGDDEWSKRIEMLSPAKVVRVGQGSSNTWRATWHRLDSEGVRFRVEGPAREYCCEYRVNLLGSHQVGNALFAIAVGQELGVAPSEIQRGLAECQPAKMRMQSFESNGIRILNDAYNANADSMEVALRTLIELPCKGRRVAVLGDMAELGVYTEKAHEEVGRAAARMGVGQLFAVGKMAGVMGRSAKEAGLLRVFEFADVDSAGAAVKSFVRAGDLVLVKASRSTRLERVAEMLRGMECFTT